MYILGLCGEMPLRRLNSGLCLHNGRGCGLLEWHCFVSMIKIRSLQVYLDTLIQRLEFCKCFEILTNLCSFPRAGSF